MTLLGPDTIGLSGKWREAEFNLFGNGNYSTVYVNPGASLGVTITTLSGPGVEATYTPAGCNSGANGAHTFTAESSNFTPTGACCPSPTGIFFSETNNGPAVQYPFCAPIAVPLLF